MASIPANELERGVEYWIDHRGKPRLKRVGVFDVLLETPPPVHARFSDVRGRKSDKFQSPLSAYRVDEWTFRKSGPIDTDPEPLAPGGGRRRRKTRTRKHKRVSRKTRRNRK